MYKYLLAAVLGFILLFLGAALGTRHARDTRPLPASVNIANNPRQLYEVVKVIDGDTIDVRIGGQTERIRLIGINTPETVDPRKLVECFGVEASNKAKTVLTGKKVIIESDSSQDEYDK